MKKGSGITKQLPAILETTAGAVAGNVASNMIESKNLMGLGKFAGLVVAAAGLGASVMMSKNELIKNVALGMVTSGLSNFANGLMDKKPLYNDQTGVKLMGLRRRLNGNSMIGAIPKISDNGYSSISSDNVAKI